MENKPWVLSKKGEKMGEKYKKIHEEAFVFDGTCPLAFSKPEYIDKWIEGGATAIAPTVAQKPANCTDAIKNIAKFYKIIRKRSDELMLIKKVKDFESAKEENKLGMVLAFQTSTPLENNVDLIEVFHQLGLRMHLIAYNTKNFLGDGCSERTDCGLSEMGIKTIKEMNRVGITVDCAHTGFQTSMETVEVSDEPVIISHANSKEVHDNPRNINDELAIAIAESGGLVGVNGYPSFVAEKKRPTIDDLIDHIDHYVDLLGIDHVGIGIDYWRGQHPVASKKEQKETWEYFINAGVWSKEVYPHAINYFPKDMELPSGLPNLTKKLLERGYSKSDVEKILGKNFLRVFKNTWK